MSLIEEATPKQVRMAHLAIVGSHSVNGVSATAYRTGEDHSGAGFLPALAGTFNNKTNGVTQRRWLLQANPVLADLMTRDHRRRLDHRSGRARASKPCADDAGFQQEFLQIKRANKERLARVIRRHHAVTVGSGFALRCADQTDS